MSKTVKAAIKEGREALKLKNYTEALNAFSRAAEQYEALETPEEGLDAVYFEWAHALYRAEQPGEALKKISLFLEKLTAFPDDLQERLQYLLAQCHFEHAQQIQQEQPEKAHSHYHKALGYHGLTPEQRADAYYKQGVVLTRLKDFKAASHSLHNALDCYAQQQQSFWVGMTRLKIGMLALTQGQVEPAQAEALKVISQLEADPNPAEHAVLKTAYDLMAELCQYQKDPEGTKHWRERSELL